MQVPLDQIQGNITPGFRKDHQAFLFFRFDDADDGITKARKWIAEIRPLIATANEVATFNQLFSLVKNRLKNQEHRAIRATWINMAFSAQGLRKLGWEDDCKQFAKEFGLDPKSRAAELGEAEISDGFEIGGNDDREPDVVLIVAVDSDDLDQNGIDSSDQALRDEVARQVKCAEKKRVTLIAEEQFGRTLGTGREHFGFRDGITHPDPENPLDGWNTMDDDIVAPGEFILGLPRARASNGGDLSDFQGPKWASHGSFLVFRKLEQNVKAFNELADKAAGQLGEHVEALRQELADVNLSHLLTGMQDAATAITPAMMKARFVGRWPSGVKLTDRASLAATSDPGERNGELIPFGEIPRQKVDIAPSEFSWDVNGDGCPFFSHIRKSHPRARLSANERRLIRRGITYGPSVDKDPNAHRGIFFLAYQASIADQFRQIQAGWLANVGTIEPPAVATAPNPLAANIKPAERPGIAGAGGAPSAVGPLRWLGSRTAPGYDPIVGTPEKGAAVSLHLRGAGDEAFVTLDMEPVVAVRGTGYFFAPSIAAIEMLSVAPSA